MATANLSAQVNTTQLGHGYNDGFYNEIRVNIDDTLANIGVYTGIKTKVFVTWELQSRNGSISDLRDELNYTRGEGRKLVPGIVRGYKDAMIHYISEVDNTVLAELPMDLITGDTFCASCEEINAREQEERLNEAAERARDASGGRMRGMEEGLGRGEMDGGFSHEGGGFNPMGQGAFDIGFDAMGSNIGVSGVSGANSFRGVQGVQGVGVNMNSVGR